jgi:hypothetical protein
LSSPIPTAESASTTSGSSSATATPAAAAAADKDGHETPFDAWITRWLGSNAALTVGLGGNIIIFALKAVNALLTGSSTMLVEVFHSLIDALNQYWLKRTSVQMDQRQVCNDCVCLCLRLPVCVTVCVSV